MVKFEQVGEGGVGGSETYELFSTRRVMRVVIRFHYNLVNFLLY
jgi:hypothetical protein